MVGGGATVTALLPVGGSPVWPRNMLAARIPLLMNGFTFIPFAWWCPIRASLRESLLSSIRRQFMRQAQSRWFYRLLDHADFNAFATHASIADHAFFAFALAELARFILKWFSRRACSPWTANRRASSPAKQKRS